MRAARGFTLLEMVVVIALFAAITALAASVVSRALPGQQLRRATKQMAAELRYTRARAIASGKPQLFVFDTARRQWRGPDRHHGELPASVDVVATGARSEQVGDRSAVVRFFPEGAATGGRFVLRHGRAAWQVDVEWLTGEVTISRAGAGT